MPTVRDANRVAALLVQGALGEQVGQLYGPYGTLFRNDRDLGDTTTLPQRIVPFAALHAPWLDLAAVGRLMRRG